jgi:DNA gyrase subunit A
MGIRFEESDVRIMGRVSAGVRGINLRDGDWVEEVAIVSPDEENDILVVTDLGFGKRTAVDEFRVQRRGGYGVKLIQLTAKTGVVAGIRQVHELDQAMVLTEGGMVIRTNVGEISRYGRSAQGVRVIRLDEGDRVVSVVKLAEDTNGDADADDHTDDHADADADTGADTDADTNADTDTDADTDADAEA